MVFVVLEYRYVLQILTTRQFYTFNVFSTSALYDVNCVGGSVNRQNSTQSNVSVKQH